MSRSVSSSLSCPLAPASGMPLPGNYYSILEGTYTDFINVANERCQGIRLQVIDLSSGAVVSQAFFNINNL